MLLGILRELAPDELLIDIRQLVNDKVWWTQQRLGRIVFTLDV